MLTQDNTPIASDKIKANTPQDGKKIGSFNNPQPRYEIPIDKRPPNQFSHKQPLEQTQYYQNEVLIRDNTPITSDQLPPNLNLRERSRTQVQYHCEYPRDLKEPYKTTPEQYRGDARQTRGQLSPHYVETTPNSKGNKKSIQFRNPKSDPGYNYNSRVYNPILITPRHPYTESPVNEPERPKRISSPPEDPPDSRGRYFSGTVENGQGGDFYGYYFASRASIDLAVKRTFYPTSTPNIENYHPNRSILSRQTGHLIPRKLFPKVRDSTPHQR